MVAADEVRPGIDQFQGINRAMDTPGGDQAYLGQEFAEVAARFAMNWQLVAESRRPRVMVAVSRTSHCLNDLLHRHRSGHAA